MEELRDWSAASLPSVARPARNGIVDVLPTTDTGKVNRSALHAIGQDEAMERTGTEEPRSSDDYFERHITEKWKTVLKRDDVAATLHFGDLNGDSILAVEVVSGIGRVFGYEVPPAALAETSTVHKLAAVVKAASKDP